MSEVQGDRHGACGSIKHERQLLCAAPGQHQHRLAAGGMPGFDIGSGITNDDRVTKADSVSLGQRQEEAGRRLPTRAAFV